MNDFLVSAAVILLGIVAAAVMMRAGRLVLRVRQWLWVAFALHVMAAVVMVLITRDYYGYGDMLAYHRTGLRLAEQLRSDFGGFAPDLFAMFLHQPNDIVGVHGNGWSTGSMHAIGGVLAFLLGGSLFGACIFLALMSFAGKVAMWRGLVAVFPAGAGRQLFVACVLFPSSVFWTAGLLKESVAVTGLGWLFLGSSDLAVGKRRPLVLLLAVAGTLLIGLTKAYVLFAFALAIGVAWLAAQTRNQTSFGIRAARPIAALLAVVALTAALGVLFPRYSPANLAGEMVSLRELGRTHAGGSTIAEGELGAVGSGDVLSGLATALFRPFLFEVRNPLMFISATETTFLLVLVAMGAYRTGLRRMLGLLRTHPGLAFCLTFTCAFAVGVGVSSTNLGTLARYRVPMLPFYAATALSLSGFGQRRPNSLARPSFVPDRGRGRRAIYGSA